jgi:hypothetical protein
MGRYRIGHIGQRKSLWEEVLYLSGNASYEWMVKDT